LEESKTYQVVGMPAVDPWMALQERKRRKLAEADVPIVESTFARLARKAANE
jgi:hypothetical protein